MGLRFGTFLAPFHPAGENSTLALKAIQEHPPEQMPTQPRKAS